jgi:glycosyltransferase involved in cell wall biosynthesis
VPEVLRIRIEGVRPAFTPRARHVLATFAEALGARAAWTDREADITYAPDAPQQGVWIPADARAQRFFEGTDPFPSRAVHRARGLDLLFPPTHPDAPIPGDIVAGAFFLLSRWDERHVPVRDRLGRMPLSAGAFGQIAGLSVDEPLIETYLDALRAALRMRPPAGWGVALTHRVDGLRMRTPVRLAALARRDGPRALARAVLGPDPWDNLPDVLETTWRRGLRSTIFLPADIAPGTSRRLAAAVRAGGGEVALSASPAAAEDWWRLAEELARLRGHDGPLQGVHLPALRLGHQETLRRLEAAGAAYTCDPAVADTSGFVTGLARPHRPYLIAEDRPAELLWVPLATSDASLAAECSGDPEAARERALALLERVRRAGGRVAVMWHSTTIAGARGPAWRDLWGDLVDELGRGGARLGPAGHADPRPAGERLDGRRVMHLTTVHRPRDVRIFHKEGRALARAGARATVAAPARRLSRTARPLAGWRLLAEARRRGADLYHVHDPELLPAALWLSRATGAPVIYDVHEYLGQTARTKAWLPAALRLPIALAAERVERLAGRRLAAVVTSNEDLAARFAADGARAVSVANSPWSDSFPEPEPPSGEPVVLYVGGIGPLRGLGLMREAFPMVDVPGARLVLAGPGDPGELPDEIEHLGVVDHSAVPGLLARAAVAWIPLQRHGNYDRAVPTKLIEAMAAGRPVVTSDLGRTSAIVRAAGCGIIVPAADAEAHAHALSHLLANPERAAAMGAAGRRAFLDGLDFDTEARSLTALYAEILD